MHAQKDINHTHEWEIIVLATQYNQSYKQTKNITTWLDIFSLNDRSRLRMQAHYNFFYMLLDKFKKIFILFNIYELVRCKKLNCFFFFNTHDTIIKWE